MTTVTIL